MRELHLMRGPNRSKMLLKKSHDMLPMEDPSLVERASVKHDCALFAVGSH